MTSLLCTLGRHRWMYTITSVIQEGDIRKCIRNECGREEIASSSWQTGGCEWLLVGLDKIDKPLRRESND